MTTHTIYCCHPQETVDFLSKFKSPAKETSAFKGIPMDLQGEVLKLLPSKNRRLRYRGTSKPSFRRPQSDTIRKYADTFAIYYDNNVKLKFL
jgi:hypothetical protein